MEQTFLYEVRPHRPITGLHSVQCIRHPKSLYLTKEDVEICLKNATVYRRFANIGKLERVTTTNLDRLHHENFIDDAGKVVAPEPPKAEEKKPEPAPAPVVEASKEESKVEEPVEETKVQESEPEAVEETVAEESSSDESETSEDAPVANEEENSGESDPEQQEAASDEAENNDNNVMQNSQQNQNSNRHHKHKR